jgi:hypothetical protein
MLLCLAERRLGLGSFKLEIDLDPARELIAQVNRHGSLADRLVRGSC